MLIFICLIKTVTKESDNNSYLTVTFNVHKDTFELNETDDSATFRINNKYNIIM
jgi:hypothetical protein